MLKAIKMRDGELASRLMAEHLQGVVDFAKSRLTQPENELNWSFYLIWKNRPELDGFFVLYKL